MCVEGGVVVCTLSLHYPTDLRHCVTPLIQAKQGFSTSRMRHSVVPTCVSQMTEVVFFQMIINSHQVLPSTVDRVQGVCHAFPKQADFTWAEEVGPPSYSPR